MSRRLVCLLLLGLGACSSLSFGYGQLARLAGWWIDGYLDLDRVQTQQLHGALEQLQAWHRREELAQWQALLAQAQQALDGGLSEAELLRLEAGADASLRRTLEQAAPLARPLLARLRPAQWQHLQARMAEKFQDWREREAALDGDDRARQYLKQLERWLGDLPPAAERLARQQAHAWPATEEALWQERAQRQQAAERGLRAWAAGDLSEGVQLLMAAAGRDPAQRGPAEQRLRQRQLAALRALLPLVGDAPRARWAHWHAELQALAAAR